MIRSLLFLPGPAAGCHRNLLHMSLLCRWWNGREGGTHAARRSNGQRLARSAAKAGWLSDDDTNQSDQHTKYVDGLMRVQHPSILATTSAKMMIAWLVVLAVLLYVFRALSRPQVDGEPAAAAQEEPTVVPAEVCDPRPTLAS